MSPPIFPVLRFTWHQNCIYLAKAGLFWPSFSVNGYDWVVKLGVCWGFISGHNPGPWYCTLLKIGYYIYIHNIYIYIQEPLLIEWGCTPKEEQTFFYFFVFVPHTLAFWVPGPSGNLYWYCGLSFNPEARFRFFEKLCAFERIKTRCSFCKFFWSRGWISHVIFLRMGWNQTEDIWRLLCIKKMRQLYPISRCFHSRQIPWHLEVPAFAALWSSNNHCPMKSNGC